MRLFNQELKETVETVEENCADREATRLKPGEK